MKKKMFGAVAVSAALALGCAAPAFAEPTNYDQTYTDGALKYGVDDKYQQIDKADVAKDADGDGERDGVAIIDDQQDGNSQTPVYIQTNIAQINVAVPTKLVFVAESIGGDMMVPSAGVYSIQNYTTKAAIYITDIEAAYADEEENWVLVDDATLVGEGVEATTAKRANLMVGMASDQDLNGKSVDFTIMPDAGNLIEASTADTDPLKIDKSIENGGNVLPGQLDFTFDARSSVVKDAQSANGQEIQAFNILFTIGTSSGK